MKKNLLFVSLLISVLTVNGSVYADNVKDVINKEYVGYEITGSGGAITYDSSVVQAAISGSIFQSNKAALYGGAIYNAANDGNFSSISITDKTVFNNNSAKSGGAIYNEGKLFISNVEFSDNNATASGGAIYNKGITTLGGIFNNNTASSSGGAIYNTNTLTINDNTKFISNTASTSSGGAIYTKTGPITIGDNVVFSENKSLKSQGGAIYAHDATSKIIIGHNAIFNSNTSNQGGAIFTRADLTIKDNAKFTNNISNSNSNGVSISGGGAIYVGGGNTIIGNNATFSGNNVLLGTLATHEARGGAIYANNKSGTFKIGDNAVFMSNNVEENGGAIYNNAKEMTIGENSVFYSNTATGKFSLGGAIFNNTILNIGDGANFQQNSAIQGGAIFHDSASDLSLNKAVFISNSAKGNNDASSGGAIFLSKDDNTGVNNINIVDSYFEGNSSLVSGGAIQQGMNTTFDITVENSIFKDNITGAEGGAIASDSNLIVKDSQFIGNKTTSTKVGTTFNDNDDGGGAIMLYDDSKAIITGSTFINNSSGTYGGAIGTRTGASNDKSSLKVENSLFSGNSANVNGGAISSHVDAEIKDSSFTGNKATNLGGGIWANKNLTISAENSDIVFSGNTASDGGDIFMNTAASNLTMNIAEGKTITSDGGISGNSAQYKFNVSGGGNLNLMSYLKNAEMVVDNSILTLAAGDFQVNGYNNNITVNNGGFNILNNHVDKFDDGIITLNGNVNLTFDVDLASGQGDFLSNIITDSTTVNISEINPIAKTTKNYVQINVADALGIDNSKLVAIDPQAIVVNDALTPIRYLKGSIDENGILTYVPTGNSYKDFNPSILVSPVAAQLGGYFVQLNSYDEAFRNLDMKMLMTQEERKAMRIRNSYAAAGGSVTPMVFSPTYLPEKEQAGWVRPYAVFENVPLKNGPKVSNVMYGTFFGGDSDMYELENGALVQFSAYAGYNGSHQAFSGNSIYQNGANLGLTGIIYKDNFFSALTANVGASVAEASTMYGTEYFPMLMAGVASKTGYNWELAKGKFIIQPNYLMSYTFVNTFDYTNAADVRIKSDPLHAIQIAPGLKFIGNLKHGWQPYINLRMVWNIMDKTEFMAAETSLPGLSTKPYFEYGVGLQKRWGERFTGFGQAMIRNGGRNGVALGFGLRWAVGKAPYRTEYKPTKKVIKKSV